MLAARSNHSMECCEAKTKDSLIVVLVHTERGLVDAWLREHETRPS